MRLMKMRIFKASALHVQRSFLQLSSPFPLKLAFFLTFLADSEDQMLEQRPVTGWVLARLLCLGALGKQRAPQVRHPFWERHMA